MRRACLAIITYEYMKTIYKLSYYCASSAQQNRWHKSRHGTGYTVPVPYSKVYELTDCLEKKVFEKSCTVLSHGW